MAMLQIVSLLTLAALAASQCPDGFTPYGNNACYMPVAQKLPWVEAERFCNSYSSCSSGGLGHLVSIHSERENTFVHSLYNTLFFVQPEAFWIGYNDRRTDGQFEWSDGWTPPPGATAFNKWAPNLPGFSSVDDCVVLDGTSIVGQAENWLLRGCMTPNAFVCIIEDTPSMECPAPTTPPVRPGV